MMEWWVRLDEYDDDDLDIPAGYSLSGMRRVDREGHTVHIPRHWVVRGRVDYVAPCE